jgi:hypothetical protein
VKRDAKITRGGSFRGAARYALDERRGLGRDHQPEIVGGNMAGRTSAELTREFEAVRQQRPDIRKPVEHVALGFARDERSLSNDEMSRLANEYLGRRDHDPDRVQYVVVRHGDRGALPHPAQPHQDRSDRGPAAVPRVLPEQGDMSSPRARLRSSACAERPPARGRAGAYQGRGPDCTRSGPRLGEGAAQGPDPRRGEGWAHDKRVREETAGQGSPGPGQHRPDGSRERDQLPPRSRGGEGERPRQGLQQRVRYDRSRDLPTLERAARATKGLEPLRRRRRPLRLPSPSRALSRLPGYQEARTALWLSHNLELAGRAPGRAALNIAERLLPPDARTAVRVIRTIIDLSRGR